MNKFLCTALALSMGVMAQSQIISNEDFENGIPSGWTQTTLATDGGWIAGNNGGLSSQSFAIPAHSNMLATNDDGCDCDKSMDILETSSYDLSSYIGEAIRIKMDLFFLLGTYQGATESLELMISVNGGSWNSIHTFSGSTEWQEATFIDISAYAGESDVKFAFNYSDGAGWTFGAAIDNFTIEIPNEHDIKLTSVKVPPYSATDVPQIIKGVITNLGGSVESAISVTWTDGTNTNTANLTGSLNPGQSMMFEHPDGISLASGTSITVDVEVGITGDANLANNELTGYTVEGVAFWPNKVVVGEEGTGTWCGWCPRGMVGMEYMEEEYGEDWIGIAVHNGDPMTNDDYDSWMAGQISGYPSGLVDREGDIDPSAAILEQNFLVAIEKFAYASIGVMPLIDENEEVEVRIDVKFAVDMEEDMSVAVMLVEDGLTGTGNDWSQANYYSGGGSGQLTGAGLDWHNEPGSVAGLTFNDVARDPLLGADGDDGIIPGSVEEGQIVNYVMAKFDWNQDYDKENTRFVVMLLNDNTGEVINAVESYLMDLIIVENNGVTYYVIDGDTFQLWDDEYLVPTGIENTTQIAEVKVFPNPSSNLVSISSGMITDQSNIQIFDMTGKMILNRNDLGVQQTRFGNGVKVDVSTLPTGLYKLVITNDDSSIKQSISVMH
jgi:hypothetical protein